MSPIAAQAKQWRGEHGVAMIKHKHQTERIAELEGALKILLMADEYDHKEMTNASNQAYITLHKESK